MNGLRKWLHDHLEWGYPTACVEGDPFQPVHGCRFCDGRLAEDSQGNWFHLPVVGDRTEGSTAQVGA